MGILPRFLTGEKSPEILAAEEAQQTQAQQLEEGNVASAGALKDYSQNYDQEWVKFLAELSVNESAADIIAYIQRTEWTDRQKEKLMAFTQITLGKNVGATYITGINDFRRATDDFTLAECNLTLGMTVFDMSPEFLLIIDLIKQHFLLSLRRSKGGMFLERIGTSRVEFSKDGSRDEYGYKGQRHE